MPKNRNKEVISAFLAKQKESFRKLDEKKALAAFFEADKSHKAIRIAAFTNYFREYKEGWDPKATVIVNTNAAVATMEAKNVKLKPFTPGVAKLDKSLFEAFKTGKGIDRILSDEGEGGIMPGTTLVVVGDGGVGKSTVCYDIQAQLKINYPKLKIGCVQSEMKRIDLEWEALKKDWMVNAEFLVLKDYGYENARAVLEKIFTSGYHVLIIDSFEDIIAKLKEYCMLTEGQAEQLMLNWLDDFNEGKNNDGIYGAAVAIQQVTKGGVFKGSNKLKHNTTGMLYLKFDERDERYGVFGKNRRGGKYVGKKMYFSLDSKNNVMWDKSAFESTLAQAQFIKEEKLNLAEKSKGFSFIFAKNKNEEAAKLESQTVNVDELEVVDRRLDLDEDDED